MATIFILKLEDLSILVVDQLRLLLNSLTKAKIALQHLFHHVDCVNDPASDSILCFVSCVIARTTLCHDCPSRTNTILVYSLDGFAIGASTTNTTFTVTDQCFASLLCYCRVLALQTAIIFTISSPCRRRSPSTTATSACLARDSATGSSNACPA